MKKYLIWLAILVGVFVGVGWSVVNHVQSVESTHLCRDILLIDRFSDLRLPSGATAHDIRSVLQGSGLEGLSSYFVHAEKAFNVNAVFLASVAILESGWGTSRIFKEKNNPFGFAAYTDRPYDSARSFPSHKDAIFHVAQYISKEYLDPSGKWYVSPTIDGVSKNYADDPEWGDKIERIARQFKATGGCHD